jgi:hypothetical protein
MTTQRIGGWAAFLRSIAGIGVLAVMIPLWGANPALAQGLPTMGAPATGVSPALPTPGVPLPTPGVPLGAGASASPGGTGAPALGTIQLNQGSLGQPQGGAIGAIAGCPASEMAGVLPGIIGTTSTTVPFVPLVTSPFAPPAPSTFGTPALTQFGTLSIPPIGTPTTPAFGTSTTFGVCSPTAPAQPAPLGIPESLAPGIGAAFSDAAIPLEATEAGGGGLSPLISVPPPAISSSGCVGTSTTTGTSTMMGTMPLATPSNSASGASPC